MKELIQSLVGGIVIIVMASVLGLVHNALRSNPLKLIQQVPSVPASTSAVKDNTVEGEAPITGEGEVSVSEMKRLYDEGFTIILDARGPGEYAEGHIPGSVNIPYDELPRYLEALQNEAPMDQPVVCYCRGPLCDLSHHLATELRLMGYGDVKVYKGGWDEWTEQGHPVNTGTEQ